jgi:hypothetical protein
MFQVVGGTLASYDEYLTCDRLYESRQCFKYSHATSETAI